MAEWIEGGGLSGYDASEGTYTLDATKFIPTTPGCVDAQASTRYQYNRSEVPFPLLIATAALRLTPDDVNFASTLLYGGRVSVTAYVVKASYFTVTPAPADVVFYARSGFGHVQRSIHAVGPSLPGGVSTYDKTFNVYLANLGLESNTKYWVVLMPTAVQGGTPAKNDYVLSSSPSGVNTYGKGLSFWTNRTPHAPSIVQPALGTTRAEGETFTLKVSGNDPDALFSPTTAGARDWAGIHVQYLSLIHI